MHLYLFIFLSFFTNIDSPNSKQYIKNYYENGTLKSEGWITNNYKTDYWYFYDKNANIKKKDILLMEVPRIGGFFTKLAVLTNLKYNSKTIKKMVLPCVIKTTN